MTRLIQIALLLAIIIPFGMAVRAFHDGLPDSGRDVWTGIVIGFLLCYALWRWDERTRQRDGADRRGD